MPSRVTKTHSMLFAVQTVLRPVSTYEISSPSCIRARADTFNSSLVRILFSAKLIYDFDTFLWYYITSPSPCTIMQFLHLLKMTIFSRIFFYFSLKYKLRVHRGDSNKYPQFIFKSKTKKTCIPLHTPVFLYKSGV